jgi:nicotinamide-nucleotide amidase
MNAIAGGLLLTSSRGYLRAAQEGPGADLNARRRTIALAESCTAGLVASAISGVEGLGRVLECGFAVYTDDAKARLLGVSRDVLKREGAASEAVARLMSEGALERAEGDIAIAITGFAGPAGPDDEEGLVHFTLARPGHATSHRVEHSGPRGTDAVRLAALEAVIDLLEHAAEL